MFILDKVKLRVCILGETWHLSAKICNYVIATLECPKTRKSPKPDPARIFRVFWGVTWETWNFIKLNPARPRPEFSGSGFFPGFRVHHVRHPTNTHRKVWKNFAKLTFAAAFIPKLHQHCCCYSAPVTWATAASPRNSFARESLGYVHPAPCSQQLQQRWACANECARLRASGLMGRLGSKAFRLSAIVG